MKAIVKHLTTATIIALFLVTFNVNAEGTEKPIITQETVETDLELDSWMTDSNLWDIKSTEIFATEVENELEMESWMVADSTWDMQPILANETENTLQLEDWMTNKNFWNIL